MVVVIESRTSGLKLVEGVVLSVYLVLGASGDRCPAAWRLPLTLPTNNHWPFSLSTTAQTAGKVFWGNVGCEADATGGLTTPILVSGISIIDEAEVPDAARGQF